MTTKIFAAFVAAMMSVATMNATNNSKKNNTQTPDILPGVTVTAQKKTIEFVGRDNKYEYNLDDKGRVSTKVSYAAKDFGRGWTPIAAYSVFYGEEETVLTYAEFNPTTGVFNLNPQQKRYNAKEYPELIRVPQVK